MSQRLKSSPRGPLHREAIQAMWEAIWDVIQDHKRTGQPLVVWKNDQVTYISPEEAEAEHLAARARAEADGTLPRREPADSQPAPSDPPGRKP